MILLSDKWLFTLTLLNYCASYNETLSTVYTDVIYVFRRVLMTSCYHY